VLRVAKVKLVALSAVLVLLLCIILFLAHEQVLLAVGSFLVIQDDLQPADLIHVIAGEDDRTEVAVQLYKQGYGKKIFFTGGWCTFHNYYHGQHGRELALQQGVPAEAIALDDSWVTSTYSEVVKLKEFLALSPTPIRSVIVVSDAYHMRRVRWTTGRLLGDDVRVQMAPVPFEVSPYQRRWWTDGASRAYVRDEYLKMTYYIARYQLSWGPLQEWLASFDVN
jgi:uncharacterized SAM-binding protein YcdF (DUF218 family)